MTEQDPAAVVLFAPHPKKPETKNCWRFEATEEGAPVTSLYVRKELSTTPPAGIRVTVEILS